MQPKIKKDSIAGEAKESKQIIIQQTGVVNFDIEKLISQAVTVGTSVEGLERLLAMRRELKAEWAKGEFNRALAKAQSEFPVIQKRKSVYEKDGKTSRYKYAPIDDIVEQVRNPLVDNGLSYTFDELKDATFTQILCKITHVSGHSEVTTFKIPIGTEAYMSDVQKYGARMTFGKRYAFCNALGIMTGDEDNDGNVPAAPAAKPLARSNGNADGGSFVQGNFNVPSTPRPVAKTTSPLASAAQKNLIRKIADEKHLNLFDEGFKDVDQMSVKDAMECIDHLKVAPAKEIQV